MTYISLVLYPLVGYIIKMIFMQHIRNGLILHLINSLKNNIVKASLTPKIMISFKKSRTTIEIASLDKNNLFIHHNLVHD